MRIMKIVGTATVLLLMCITGSSQQLRLGKNPYALQKSAILELESDNQGLLFPRITDTTFINTSNPPDGMVIYFTATKQLLLRASGYWQPLTLANALNNYWSTEGNSNGSTKRIGSIDNFGLSLITNNINRVLIDSIGNIGLGLTAPTALLHLKAGSAAANRAPLKFTSGALMTTAEAGGVEFLADKYYGTITTGAARKEFTLNDAALTSGRVPVVTTNGRLTSNANFVWDNTNSRLGVRATTPTAFLHLGAGSIAAGTAPLKFTSGINLTTPEAGAMEFNGTHFYVTVGTTRFQLDQQAGTTYTGSNGITLTGTDFRNNLITGLAGGQTIIGGTAPANALILSSTSHATKGGIFFGASVYDEANNRLGIGNSTPTETLDITGNVKFNGALMPNNAAGVAGNVLSSNGSGLAPSWRNLAISNLSDAAIATPVNGQLLQYNGTKWVNTTNAYLTGIDTTNISNFHLKVKGLLSAGTGIAYSSNTGVISNTGVTSLNGNTGALVMDTGYIGNFYFKSRSLLSAGTGITYNPSTGVISSSINTGSFWSTVGNAGTAPGSQFMGTTDLQDLAFRTNNAERMRLDINGRLGIGTTTPNNLLEVAGTNTTTGLTGLRLTNAGIATPASSTGKVLSVDNNGNVIVTNNPGNTAWDIAGNANTTAGTSFLGTTDDKPLLLKSNNSSYAEMGRRQTLGLVDTYPDYTDPNEQVLHMKSAVQFYAPAAAFYKPKIFVDPNGNFRTKGSSAGTDFFEFGATGSNNNGGFEFIIGDDGDEPIVFKSYNYLTGMSEMMRLQSGRMAVGSNAFDASNPEKLLIDAGVTNSFNLMTGKGSINNYLQINVQNRSNGSNASSDLVATSDNGDEGTNFIDMGINSSGFTNTSYPILGGINNAYLYSTGNDFILGNGTVGKNLRFFTGGFGNSNERLRIDDTGKVGIGTTSPATALHVSGTNPLTLTGLQSGASTDSILTADASGTVRKRRIADVLSGTSITSLNGLSNAIQTYATGTTGNDFAISSSGSTHTFSLPDASVIARGLVTTGAQTLSGSKTLSSAPLFSSLTPGSVPFIGAGGLLSQNNAAFFWDATNNRLGINTNTPGADLTLSQNAGTGPTKGFRFTGNSIGGTNTGTGFGMSLGYNIPGNKQLWLGDADFLGNASGVFVRYSSTAGMTIMDAIDGVNINRKPLSLGVGGDPSSGVIFGSDNNSASPGSYVWDNGNMAIGSSFRANAAPANGLAVQGNVAIGVSALDATFPEKLLVDAGTTTSVNAIVGKGSIDSYLQLNIQNKSTGTSASSDVVATANNGSETTNFIDMGINGSNYAGGVMGAGNDAYLYNLGQNLLIGTGTAAKSLVFMTGGTTQSTNERMRIDGAGSVGINTAAPNSSTKLDVNGAVKIGAKGTVEKNVISFEVSFAVATGVPGAAMNTLFSTFSPGALETTITIPAANTPTTTRGSVSISTDQDLPSNVSIASARVSATNAVRIRFLNAGTAAQSIPSGLKLYVTIVEF